jgi:6-phosphofructokinase 1
VDARPLDLQGADPAMVRMAGTILGTTNRGDPFAYPMPDGSLKDRSEEVIEGVRLLGLDALIGIGGDGSFAILRRLAQQGSIPFIGIPKTIDNDVGATESAVGYHTAVMVATEAIDRLQPTAASHDRVMILEVMGRDSGQIALAAGIAGAADVILVPEIPYDIGVVAEHISKLRHGAHNFAIVVVAEAVRDKSGSHVQLQHASGRATYGGIGHVLGETISQMTGAETRVTVLGHVQRGGQPTWDDRLIASAFGVRAVDLIAEGKSDRMVAWQTRRVVDVPMSAAFEPAQRVASDDTLVRTARGLGICLGDSPP